MENGLVKIVMFEPVDYRSPCFVWGRLVYVNPTDVDLSLDLSYPIPYDVFYVSGRIESGGLGGGPTRVKVPAHGEYPAASISFQAMAPGHYEVECGGVSGGVDVRVGDVVMRLVTDKQLYQQFEGGKVTFEFYNPGSSPASATPPSQIELGFEINGVKQENGQGVNIDWVSANFTVPPGGTFKIFTFTFTTSKVGQLTLTGMGLRKTVKVLPLEP